ncbi:MAG: hypothetical protein Q9159_006065 [Coniocarpon cinnabarinum]
MFPHQGLFNGIACPVGKDCELLYCLFAHEQTSQDGHAMDIDEISTLEVAHPSKRQKVGEAANGSAGVEPAPSTVQPPPTFAATRTATPQKSQQQSTPKVDGQLPKSFLVPHRPASASIHMAEHRPISPPPSRKPEKVASTTSHKAQGLQIKHATEPLNPRMLVQAPAAHQTRTLYLKKLHEGIGALNERAKKDSSMHEIVLAPQQLVTLALDEEQKIAKENFSVYANIIKLRMVAYKKMTLDAWKIHLLQLCQIVESDEQKKLRMSVTGERDLQTGLSETQERQILPHLFAKLHGLEEHGYLTGAPSSEDMAKAQKGDEVADGWEKCARCQARFQVFPDRRQEDGVLTSGGKCTYHPGRIVAGYRGREAVHGCCNETIGKTVGCDYHPCHVFKVESPNRLSLVMEYEHTPDNCHVANDVAISLDCEMGYTTRGFELIRLTALSWPRGEKILDVLVRPFGYVLDLNTRFSGVNVQQFQEATPYDSHANADSLQIVGSPIEARKLFFEKINPSTPLIGHGLDNDLAALRIIHPCIVDTALLCPHARGLPYRRALKQLAREYIFRTIQNAGLAGHDSAEDAKAAGDIVLELVKRKWRKMKENGWKAEDGKLVPPKMAPPKPNGDALKHDQARSYNQTLKNDEAALMEDQRTLLGNLGHKRSREDMDDGDREANMVELDYD